MAVTISDIAKEAGVSTATVSRMMNNSGYVKEETRKLVEQAIKKLNYIPNAAAVSLSKKVTNVIGVIVPDLVNPFFGEIISGISKIADEKGYAVMLCNSSEDPNKELRALTTMQQQQMRGLLITPVSDNIETNSTFYSQLKSIQAPIIIMDREVDRFVSDGVYYDNLTSAYDATSYLIQEGHKKIAVIAGSQKLKIGRDRLNGYRKALRDNQLPVIDEYIIYGDFTLEGAYKGTKQLLQLVNQPTAIFSCNNMMTHGLLKGFIEEHKEKDYSLLSFDRVDFSDVLNIDLKYLERDSVKMGEVATELLIKRIEGDKSEYNRVILPSRLV